MAVLLEASVIKKRSIAWALAVLNPFHRCQCTRIIAPMKYGYERRECVCGRQGIFKIEELGGSRSA